MLALNGAFIPSGGNVRKPCLDGYLDIFLFDAAVFCAPAHVPYEFGFLLTRDQAIEPRFSKANQLFIALHAANNG